MACGMQVVAADIGGLPEALGRCGTTFPPGNAAALAAGLEAALARRQPRLVPTPEAARHLEHHQAGAVARAYLAHLMDIAPSSQARAGAAT